MLLNQLTVLRELLGGFGAENVSVDRNLELARDVVVPTRVDLTARAEERARTEQHLEEGGGTEPRHLLPFPFPDWWKAMHPSTPVLTECTKRGHA